MATRKDLLKAHTFTTGRLVSAVVDRDPDRLDSPLRRVGLAFFASIMVAVLIIAGFGIAGFLLGGGRSRAWKEKPSAVVVDSQAGQAFWYFQGQLHPMENIASALLAAGPGAEKFSLKTASLRGVKRAAPRGIVGAPRTLPATQDLSLYPIRVCAGPAAEKQPRPISLEFGRTPPTAQRSPVVLTDRSGQFFLVLEGIPHKLPSTNGKQPLLLVAQQFPIVEGADRLLQTMRVGTDLSAERLLRTVKNFGEPSKNGIDAARTVGTLVSVGDSAHYILLSDGFAALKPIEFEALRAERSLKPVQLTATQVQTRTSKQEITANDLPTVMPEIPSTPGLANQSFCATFSDATTTPQITTGAPTPELDPAPRSDRATYADLVATEPGKGALVYVAGAQATPESSTLITEGLLFGIPTATDLDALGYGGVTKTPISPELLQLIPPGLPNGVQLTSDRARMAPGS